MTADIGTEESLNSPPTGFGKGHWVRERDIDNPELGHIKETYWDSTAKEWVMNLIIHSQDGERLGRTSPPRGGPSNYEPCVPCQFWEPIDQPDFLYES